MKKSKLENYEDVLEVLADKPSTIDAVAYLGNMNCLVLRQRLDFLVFNNLVEERNYKNKTLYALTRRGETINRTLRLTKRLEKLHTCIGVDGRIQEKKALQEYIQKPKRQY